jgi:ribosomal protein S18 acetylase RimI-like enzyme
MGSYLWFKAYVSLEPKTCYVLEDRGRAVGYIIGTADTAVFAQRWKDAFAPIVDSKLVPRPGLDTGDPLLEREDVQGLRRAIHRGECSMLQSELPLLRQYASHLHINLLPEYQNQGWGSALVSTFLHRVRALGASGVHLGMVQANVSARKFYERLGFRLCSEVLDGGEGGECGQQGGAICLVMNI